MKWKSNGYQAGWKKAFALFPTKVGKIWIWLEHYDVSEPYSTFGGDIRWTRRYPSRR